MIIATTIAIAVVLTALVLVLSPGRAVGVIIASSLLWPEYLRMPLGVVQMSIPRAAALALLLRLMLTGGGRRGVPVTPFRWNIVDSLVVGAWAWDVVANAAMGADETQMIQMVGRVLDTVVMYFLARLAMRSLGDFKAALIPVALTAVVMGALGAAEAIMGRSVYDQLYAFGGNPWFEKELEYRYGFLRAKGSASHSIYFGVAMSLLVGMLWAMRGVARPKIVVLIGCAAAFLGALSSLSSGPQIALVMLMICCVFYYIRWAIKPATAMLLFMCIVVEVGSNRHFFQLADYLALSSETAWYRGRLIEVAVEQVGEYWLMGVGGYMPHHWGLLIDMRLHVDIVNHYVIVAMYGGLPSLFAFFAIQVMAIRGCARLSRRTKDAPTRALAFGLASTLIMLMVASMSIGLFGPPLLITYILMGSMVSVGAMSAVRAAAPARAAAARPGGRRVPGARGAGVVMDALRTSERHSGAGSAAAPAREPFRGSTA